MQKGKEKMKLKLWVAKIMHIDSPMLLLISLVIAIGVWAWVKTHVGVE